MNGIVKNINKHEIKITGKAAGLKAAAALQTRQVPIDKLGSSNKRICDIPNNQFNRKPKIMYIMAHTKSEDSRACAIAIGDASIMSVINIEKNTFHVISDLIPMRSDNERSLPRLFNACRTI